MRSRERLDTSGSAQEGYTGFVSTMVEWGCRGSGLGDQAPFREKAIIMENI